VASDPTAEVVELLQQLIRNRCVNDGTITSGQEVRSADLLRTYLEGSGLDLQVYEPVPGRRSLVTRIEGRDPSAPTMAWVAHTDVVPVTPEGWSRDPFGGELVDGEVWGRGAVDMLNLTASMAVAVRRLADEGFRPEGTLLFLAVADEEAGGTHGAEWLTEHAYDDVRADFVLSEYGGLVSHHDERPTVTCTVAEKGVMWRRLRVRGTPGHGSTPFGADNALLKAAEVVRRLAEYRPAARVDDIWRAYVASLDLDAETCAALVDPARLWDACQALEPGFAKVAHACTHTTFSPNVVHGGVKTNVIPDVVALDVDIRTLPGEDEADVQRHLAEALGPLAGEVEVEPLQSFPATSSPTDTPLWHALERVVGRHYPSARLVPRITTGGTDNRFYRRRGAVAYGFGLFSPAIEAGEFTARFHGNDERIDVESLRLTTATWLDLARETLAR